MVWLWKYCMGVLYPSGGGLPGILETGVDEFLQEYRREAPLLMRTGLTLSSIVFVLTPFMTVFIPVPVFLLSNKLKDRHANKLANHPLYLVRQTILLLRLVAGLCWGKHPQVRAAMGMEPLGEDPGTFRGSS
jgi:hypothetical protein